MVNYIEPVIVTIVFITIFFLITLNCLQSFSGREMTDDHRPLLSDSRKPVASDAAEKRSL